mmetsp:Transcript_110444/g.356490  ORF Transcript_110444/g.356490 Transcript_110444/m.356490 type:complete len:211 (-) Transcript_110444:384-1016(-)
MARAAVPNAPVHWGLREGHHVHPVRAVPVRPAVRLGVNAAHCTSATASCNASGKLADVPATEDIGHGDNVPQLGPNQLHESDGLQGVQRLEVRWPAADALQDDAQRPGHGVGGVSASAFAACRVRHATTGVKAITTLGAMGDVTGRINHSHCWAGISQAIADCNCHAVVAATHLHVCPVFGIPPIHSRASFRPYQICIEGRLSKDWSNTE